MDLRRLARHLLGAPWRLRRCFAPDVLADIGASVQQAERTHGGEIRFAVEDALEPWALLRGQTPRDRAIELFSQLGVWDTQDNNGVLIYVLLADHAVEIVADRGILAHTSTAVWRAICLPMEAAFRCGQFRQGAQAGVDAVAHLLRRHYPSEGGDANELPDQPALL